jgi:sulfonate dioxygenase
MLSSTWNTYRKTFKRQRPGYLQDLVTRGATSMVREAPFEAGSEEDEKMAGQIIAESTSSSTTLQPYQDDGASLSTSRTDLSDSVGTLLSNMQLSALSQKDLDELVFLVATRGVLFFENQEYFDKSALDRKVGHFDPATEPTNSEGGRERQDPSRQIASIQAQDEWHTDASYEHSPPSISIFQINGENNDLGRTAFVSQYGVYDSLSKPLQRFLDELTAVHSCGQRSAEHVAVRSHPVSGLRALNITSEGVERFPELSKKESGL